MICYLEFSAASTLSSFPALFPRRDKVGVWRTTWLQTTSLLVSDFQIQCLSKSTKITTNIETAMLSTWLVMTMNMFMPLLFHAELSFLLLLKGSSIWIYFISLFKLCSLFCSALARLQPFLFRRPLQGGVSRTQELTMADVADESLIYHSIFLFHIGIYDIYALHCIAYQLSTLYVIAL